MQYNNGFVSGRLKIEIDRKRGMQHDGRNGIGGISEIDSLLNVIDTIISTIADCSGYKIYKVYKIKSRNNEYITNCIY